MSNADTAPAQAFWFALEFDVVDMPAEWEVRPDAQKDISAYELLAQTVLLVCRGKLLPPCSMTLSLSSGVDN